MSIDREAAYLRGDQARARWMRMDTASILKRFFFCERALVISQAAWLAHLAPFEIKTTLPRLLWEDAMTAGALRERVLELRFPSRMMEVGEDAPLVDVFSEAIHAPGAAAFLLGLAQVLKPAQFAAYQDYLSHADPIADGPTLRFLRVAATEKADQVTTLTRFAQALLQDSPEQRAAAEVWAASLNERLARCGGLSAIPPQTPEAEVALRGYTPFRVAEAAARDPRFHLCRYYWPDVVNPDFAYGEGIRLQLRSAVSHLNEVWAVETAGAVLYAFADELGWEFISDAARWTYDEGRHCMMGFERLRQWGFEPGEMPLGSYIYDSARGQDMVFRLGMLHYFETKNIGKKTRRAEAFASYEDRLSQHDMDFDWADETIHAHYGRKWLDELRALYPERVPDIEAVRAACNDMVALEVRRASPEERAEIQRVAEAMISKAEPPMR